MHDAVDRQSQKRENLPHPFGIAFGQVIVDRNDMHAFSGQGIEIGRQGGDQGFSFTGFHFGDVASVEHDAADQLDVEMAHLHGPPRGFPHRCEGFRQDVVKVFSVIETFTKLGRLPAQGVVVHCLHGRFKNVDLLDHGLHLFDGAFVFTSKHLGQIREIHRFRFSTCNALRVCRSHKKQNITTNCR